MTHPSHTRRLLAVVLVFGAFGSAAWAQKVLVFDEERGIRLVDKAEAGKHAPPRPKEAAPRQDNLRISEAKGKSAPQLAKVGTDFYEAGNYEEAAWFFQQAYGVSRDAEDLLWKARSLRMAGQEAESMEEFGRVLERHPKSDVADDACFYIASHYRLKGDHDQARKWFDRLLTDFDKAVSLSGGVNFQREASVQLSAMRSEVSDMLSQLGHNAFDQSAGISEFQRNAGFPVTGRADSATVAGLTAAFEASRIQAGEMREQGLLQTSRMRLWGGAALIAVLAELSLVGWLTMRLKSLREHLAGLALRLKEFGTA